MPHNPCILMVAPHPDDEVLGAGIWLHRHRDQSLHIVHLTDGSPRDKADARANGFTTRRGYARARRRELAAALKMIPVPSRQCHRFDYPDKETYLHLPALIARLETLVQRIQPALVLSPAYEGGHPDHDSAAFTVALLRRRGLTFDHKEFPLYHAGPRGEMISGEFLTPGPEESIDLSVGERDLKSQMLRCFTTQQKILREFRLDRERLRSAPNYDFTEPPHAGALLYEFWGWGISGENWRAHAREALAG